jgi:geranylgeranyl pyrophosphate synthase
VNTLFSGFLQDSQRRCSEALPRLLGIPSQRLTDNNLATSRLFHACDYAISNGGKYVRPVLVYAAELAINNTSSTSTDYPACAIELIHTYSLIHDDLPAMDDDDLRRGQPTLHRAYDESTAILAGDALQASAFELLADTPDITAEQKIDMIKILAVAAGRHGMVGGQAIDIQATDREMTLTQLQSMHSLKTGALIRASLSLGGIAAGATKSQLTALEEYGNTIGLAFQVVDDILDVTSNTATLGKTQGKDASANKATYVRLMGLDGAKEEVQHLLAKALTALEMFGEPANYLRELALYITQRKN